MQHGKKPLQHQCFQVEIIKPSNDDDDGYVIQWYRAYIPSNSLAAVTSRLLRIRRLSPRIDRNVALALGGEGRAVPPSPPFP